MLVPIDYDYHLHNVYWSIPNHILASKMSKFTNLQEAHCGVNSDHLATNVCDMLSDGPQSVQMSDH